MSFTVLVKRLSKCCAPLTRGYVTLTETSQLTSCSVAEHHIGPVHHVILMLVESLTVVVAASPLNASGAVDLSNLSASQSGSNFQLLVGLGSLEEVLVRSLEETLVILEVGRELLGVATGGVTLHHFVLHRGGHADRVNPVGVVEEAVAAGVSLDILPAIASPSAGHKVHGAFTVIFLSKLVLFRLELGEALGTTGLHGVAVLGAATLVRCLL